MFREQHSFRVLTSMFHNCAMLEQPQTTSPEDAGYPRPLVLSGPSGVGKSSIIRELIRRHPAVFVLNVSFTTRQPREGEIPGTHYHFISQSEFNGYLRNGSLLEYTRYAGNCYGTGSDTIDEAMRSGKICILDLDQDGVRAMKNLNRIYGALTVFVKPPSFDELKRRLRERKTESEEKMQSRLTLAEKEIASAENDSGLFDVILVNEDLETSVAALEQLLAAEIETSRTREGKRYSR